MVLEGRPGWLVCPLARFGAQLQEATNGAFRPSRSERGDRTLALLGAPGLTRNKEASNEGMSGTRLDQLGEELFWDRPARGVCLDLRLEDHVPFDKIDRSQEFGSLEGPGRWVKDRREGGAPSV